MTDIVPATKRIELGERDETRWAWENFIRAKVAADAANRELKRARAQYDRIVGDAEEIVLGGAVVAHYRNDGAFNAKKFTEEMPHLAKAYMKWVAKEEFDVDRFQTENALLFESYRTRILRVLKGDNS